MSDKPVWMEDWTTDVLPESSGENDQGEPWVRPACVIMCCDGGNIGGPDAPTTSLRDARRILAAAAPQMVRALLAVEWRGHDPIPYDGCNDACPACYVPVEYAPNSNDYRKPPHDPSCALDAALRAAGFTDQASRDEARKIMAETK